jgi:hypothetical protein
MELYKIVEEEAKRSYPTTEERNAFMSGIAIGLKMADLFGGKDA